MSHIANIPRSKAVRHLLNRTQPFGFPAVIFLLLHIPLAFALPRMHWLGLAHTVGVILYGLWLAVRRDSARVLYVLGYIASAEVLWRMTKTNPVWEFAEYASILIAGAAFLAERWPPSLAHDLWHDKARPALPILTHEPRKISALPIFYFLLLLPSAIVTLTKLTLASARHEIIFNLPYPLALAVLSFYLWQLRVNRGELVRLLLAIMAPVVGIVFLASYSTYTSAVTFRDESNVVTSGGFIPGQVSNLLGLGALAGVMLIAVARKAPALRVVVMLLILSFIAQGMLTFARAGTYSVILAAAVWGFHLMPARGARRRCLALAIAWTLIVVALVSSLNSYTHGALTRRFLDVYTSGRFEIAQGDILAFREHPLIGTGVGLSNPYHRYFLGKDAIAHTEPTRMLAEHGVFGLIALFVLVLLLWRGYWQAHPRIGRGLTAAFAVWAVSVMLHSALRLMATCLVMSLTQISWTLDPAEDDGE